MSKESYFVPMTLKDIEKYIHEAIRDHPELDGSELIIGGRFVYDEDDELPQGSLILTLKKGLLGEDEDDYYGSLLMTPLKARNLQ